MIDLADTTTIQSSDHMSNLIRAFVNCTNGRAGHLMRVENDAFELLISADAGAGSQIEKEFVEPEISLIREVLRSRRPKAIRGGGLVDCHAKSREVIESSNLTALSVPINDHDAVGFVVIVEDIENFDVHASTILNVTELFTTALSSLLGSTPSKSQFHEDLNSDRVQAPPTTQTLISSGIEPAFLAGVSETIANEINDPVSAIVSHSAAGLQWLNQNPPDVEKAKNSFRKITSSAFNVGRVVSSYRTSRRSAEKRPKRMLVIDVVSEALEYVMADMQCNAIEVDKSINSPATIFGERRMVVQAMINVLSASTDAMVDAGKPSAIVLRGSVKNGYYEFKVSNNQQVVGQEARDAFFDPIYSLKAGNCGIKLAVARNIALLEGGSLEIAGSSDKGTTLVLKLPVQEY